MTSGYNTNNANQEPTQFFNLDSPLYAIKQASNSGKDLIIENAPEANIASTDGYFNVSYRLFSLAAQRFNSTTSPNNYAATNTQIPTDNTKVMKLLKDIWIGETTTITSSGKIDFNGKALVYTGSKGSSGSGSVLIFDGAITNTVTATATASKSFNEATGTKKVTYQTSGGTLSYTMGGAIVGGDGNSAAGGVTLKNGAKITWDKVWILGNTSNEGAALSVNNSTITMTDCFIFRNTSDWGAIFMNNGANVTLGSNVYVQENSGTGVANTGDGGAVNIGNTGSSTLTINDGCTIKSNEGRNGGAIYANGGTVTVNGGTITANTATGAGGAFYMRAGTLNLNGGTIGGTTAAAGNSAAGNGGAVYMNGGALTVAGATLQYNKSTGSGGAIYLGGGTFSMTSGTLDHNTAATTGNATGGGAIYATNSIYGGGILAFSAVTISDATITGNRAPLGGGIAATSTVALTNVTMNTNTANTSGGALYLNGSGNYTMTGCTLSGNSSVDGGGIYVNNGTLTMSGTNTISGGSATGNGGGMYLKGALELAGGAPRITGNTKGSAANNVYLPANKTITVTGKLTTGTSGALIGVTLTNYTPVQFITNDGYGINGNDTTNVTTFVLDDTSSGNVIETKNNQVALVSPVASVTSAGTTTNYGVYSKAVTAFNAKTTDNAAKLTLLADIDTDSTTTFTSSGTLDLNNYMLRYTSTTVKYVINVNSGVNLTVTDSSAATNKHYYTVTSNQYVFGATSGSYISGGVIAGGTQGGIAVSGTLTIAGGTIAGNKNSESSNGSGVQINGAGNVTMTGGSIVGNVATTGAGVRVNGTFTMSGGTISNNYAATGAGVYVSGTFTMTGGTISNNTASGGAGGVYLYSGSSTFNMNFGQHCW
jgi:hypothetical protein